MRFINYILFVGVFSAFGFSGIVYTIWSSGDTTTKKNIETDVLLLRHAITDQSAELKKWVRQHQGDAPGSAVMTKFVNWGLEHQQEFLKIISAPKEPNQTDSMTDKIAYVIFHGGSELIDTFKESYKDFDSKDLSKIYEKLTQLELEQSKATPTKNTD